MMPHEFSNICRDLSLALRLIDCDALAESKDVYLNGVKIGVFNCVEPQNGIIFYVDLGVPELSSQPSIFERCMDINLELSAVDGEAIGFDRTTNHLVFRAFFAFDEDNNIEALTEAICGYTEFVNELYAEHLHGLVKPPQS
jgi:hypothetical protein